MQKYLLIGAAILAAHVFLNKCAQGLSLSKNVPFRSAGPVATAPTSPAISGIAYIR